MVPLNGELDQMGLIGIYKNTLPSNSSTHVFNYTWKTAKDIRIVCYKTSINKFMILILVFSDHNVMKLETNTKKVIEKTCDN